MKPLVLTILLMVIAACDPYHFGFKHNPAWVLDNAYEAVMNQDHEQFLKISGKEALCIYGHADGVTYLKENVFNDVKTVRLYPKLIDSRHFKVPEFVGFWSYYSERYQVGIMDRKTKEIMMETIVDCSFGTSGEKNESLEELNPKRYQMKECKLVKIIPHTFKALELPSKCDMLKVTATADSYSRE